VRYLSQERIHEIRANPGALKKMKQKTPQHDPWSGWHELTYEYRLPLEFLREFKHELYWVHVAKYQKMTEEVIHEFQDYVDWYWVCISQKLSEDFMREFQDKLFWFWVWMYQSLSEGFIRDFQKHLYWQRDVDILSKYQALPENLIRELRHRWNWEEIAKYQKVSDAFRAEFGLKKPKHSWLYTSAEEKHKHLRKRTDYEIKGCYLYAYKSARIDGYSTFNWHNKYEVGKEYTAHCDCNWKNDDGGPGLYAWTKKESLRCYSGGTLFKVQVPIEDVGVIIHRPRRWNSWGSYRSYMRNGPLRCRKIRVVEEL